MTPAFIGLGSNLDNAKQHILGAIDALSKLPETTLTHCSSLYITAPFGVTDQPDFINAVVKLTTRLTPHPLLQQLLAIENTHGRIREKRWGPRTLDLDMLTFGDHIINDSKLTLPHLGILARTFVLAPLLECTLSPQKTAHKTIRYL